MSALSSEDQEAARRWKHSLFSPDSEGIDDELLRYVIDQHEVFIHLISHDQKHRA